MSKLNGMSIIALILGAISLTACQPGPIDDRYIANNDGTITDTVTNLNWQRCSVGQTWTGETCEGFVARFTLKRAMKLGKDGWRLPTSAELRSLVYCTNTGFYDSNGSNNACTSDETHRVPTINIVAFPNTPGVVFWTSTTKDGYFGLSGSRVRFQRGDVDSALAKYEGAVRLVRPVN